MLAEVVASWVCRPTKSRGRNKKKRRTEKLIVGTKKQKEHKTEQNEQICFEFNITPKYLPFYDPYTSTVSACKVSVVDP